MKRKFRITVEGKSWEVEVEELGAAAGAVGEPAPVWAPNRTAPSASVGGEVRAPAPGKILRVAVKPGDRVEAHDLLLVIETMKIENRIEAPVSGKVALVQVKAGDTVTAGGLLVTLA